MNLDEKKFREMLKKKDEEIAELKELLAEAETEIKELSNFHGINRVKQGILESNFLNKLIKRTAFFLICVVVILIGVYPWLFKDTILGDNENLAGNDKTAEVAEVSDNEVMDNIDAVAGDEAATPATDTPTASEGADTAVKKKFVEVSSDLGWLNVRTEPEVETGDIIKKINSGEQYEWVEKTDTNWYKLVIDDAGHTGYVSGEYVIEK